MCRLCILACGLWVCQTLPLYYHLLMQIKTARGSTRATWQLRIPRGSQAILGRTALSADGKLAFTSLALTRDVVTTPRGRSKVITKQVLDLIRNKHRVVF